MQIRESATEVSTDKATDRSASAEWAMDLIVKNPTDASEKTRQLAEHILIATAVGWRILRWAGRALFVPRTTPFVEPAVR